MIIKIWEGLKMIVKISVVESFSFPKGTGCTECGKLQVIKWASEDDGRNITLTFSHNHEEKVQENQLKKVA